MDFRLSEPFNYTGSFPYGMTGQKMNAKNKAQNGNGNGKGKKLFVWNWKWLKNITIQAYRTYACQCEL